MFTRALLQQQQGTIQKAPLTEAQTALGKQKKYVTWNADICPVDDILRENRFFPQHLTESRQSAANYDQKTRTPSLN